MSAITELLDRRAELEERIRSLEQERNYLNSHIAALKDRLATLELERHADTLAGEVEVLRTERAVLEEKVASYESSAVSSEPYQV